MDAAAFEYLLHLQPMPLVYSPKPGARAWVEPSAGGTGTARPQESDSGLAQPHGLRNMRCNVLPEAFCDSYSSTSTTPGCPGTLRAFKPCTNCKRLLSDTCTNTCSLQILLVFCGNCFAQPNKLLPFISCCVLQLEKKKKSEALAVCSSCFSGEKASNQHSGFFLSWVNSSCETNLSKVICSMDFSHLHY